MLSRFGQFLLREPAWVAALVRQGFAVAVLFGAGFSAEQVAGVSIFVELVTTGVTRALVTPNTTVTTMIETQAQISESGSGARVQVDGSEAKETR